MKWPISFLKNALNKIQKKGKYGTKLGIVQRMEKNLLHKK